MIAYADDTVIISTADTWSESANIINFYLEKVANWLALNKLSLNIAKTVYITFGNYRDSVPHALNIKIGTELVNRVEYCKYLGSIIDYNMK